MTYNQTFQPQNNHKIKHLLIKVVCVDHIIVLSCSLSYYFGVALCAVATVQVYDSIQFVNRWKVCNSE